MKVLVMVLVGSLLLSVSAIGFAERADEWACQVDKVGTMTCITENIDAEDLPRVDGWRCFDFELYKVCTLINEDTSRGETEEEEEYAEEDVYHRK